MVSVIFVVACLCCTPGLKFEPVLFSLITFMCFVISEFLLRCYQALLRAVVCICIHIHNFKTVIIGVQNCN